MTLVPVSLGNRSYIVIEDGLLDHAGAHLAPYARNGSIVVVTDERVAAVQLARLQIAWRRRALPSRL